jgi:hypothetical protein
LVNPKASARTQDAQLRKQQAWDKKWKAAIAEAPAAGKPEPDSGLKHLRHKGVLDVSMLGKAGRFILGGVEPARITIGKHGKDVYTEVVKSIEGPEAKTLDFDEKDIEAIDKVVTDFEAELDKYDDATLDDLMLTRGHNLEGRARQLQKQAFGRLPKELKDSKIRRAIDELADYNHEYLRRVFGDEVGYIEDYFYGLYKNTRKVSTFLKFWRTTDRYTKQKAFPTYADARAHGLHVRDPNPVRNLRREFQAIARREAMINLKDNLLEHGKGRYIDSIDDAPDTTLGRSSATRCDRSPRSLAWWSNRTWPSSSTGSSPPTRSRSSRFSTRSGR